jgi:preprotein translocase SecE subunit
MSVAEKSALEQTQRNPQQQLAVGSAVGAVALLAGLGIIFAGLPVLWDEVWRSVWERSLEYKKNDFLSEALLILVELVAIGGLMFVGYGQLQKHTLPGLRAGSVLAALTLFFALWIGALLGGQMEDQFADQPALGWIVLAVVMGAILAGVGYLYLKAPTMAAFLEAVEHQGWLHGVPYKGNQGVRVRRGTIVGILAIGVFGIITMVQHHVFGADRADGNDWYWVVPFSREAFTYLYVPLMFKIHLLMPIICGVALLWIAWRTVNVPMFADFLIATEAEMNKVSWTNRRRLVQDTIVVLVTVFLFTAFLFVTDVIWIKILSAPYVQVLLIDPAKEQQKQQEKAQW